MFNKVEIGLKTANVTKLYEKKDRASGKAGCRFMEAPTSSLKATNSQVATGEGVDEGLFLEDAPRNFSEATVFDAIIIIIIF